jgi:hypothetical protein
VSANPESRRPIELVSPKFTVIARLDRAIQ